MRAGVDKASMNSPSDVSGLERLTDAGEVDPREIVAVIGAFFPPPPLPVMKG